MELQLSGFRKDHLLKIMSPYPDNIHKTSLISLHPRQLIPFAATSAILSDSIVAKLSSYLE